MAEAWDNTTSRVTKVMEKSLEFAETTFTPVKDRALLPLVKNHGCEGAEGSCVEEWTAVDDNGHQEYGDEDIVTLVQSSSTEIAFFTSVVF